MDTVVPRYGSFPPRVQEKQLRLLGGRTVGRKYTAENVCSVGMQGWVGSFALPPPGRCRAGDRAAEDRKPECGNTDSRLALRVGSKSHHPFLIKTAGFTGSWYLVGPVPQCPVTHGANACLSSLPRPRAAPGWRVGPDSVSHLDHWGCFERGDRAARKTGSSPAPASWVWVPVCAQAPTDRCDGPRRRPLPGACVRHLLPTESGHCAQQVTTKEKRWPTGFGTVRTPLLVRNHIAWPPTPPRELALPTVFSSKWKLGIQGRVETKFDFACGPWPRAESPSA